jgi:hypothetical protein
MIHTPKDFTPLSLVVMGKGRSQCDVVKTEIGKNCGMLRAP